MAEVTELVIDGLAAWRLTHLVTEDAFPPVAAAREAIIDHFGPDHSISYLVTCSYCTGVWAAAGVRLARAAAGRRWAGAARILAVAAAAPIIEAAIMRLEGKT